MDIYRDRTSACNATEAIKNRPVQTSFPVDKRHIHGAFQLPSGFGLKILPSNALVLPRTAPLDPSPPTAPKPWKERLIKLWKSNSHEIDRSKPINRDIEIASSYNVLKTAVTFSQAVSGVYTLYQTKGDQTKRYGYAAFGLSVLPYAIMAVVNLISTLLTPEYSSMYLVESQEMVEAQDRGGSFDGVVGKLHDIPKRHNYWVVVEIYLGYALIPLPYILIYILTKFQAGESTQLQRAAMLLWLTIGTVTGLFVGLGQGKVSEAISQIMSYSRQFFAHKTPPRKIPLSNFADRAANLCYSFGAVWGFITIGYMIKEYGTCTEIG